MKRIVLLGVFLVTILVTGFNTPSPTKPITDTDPKLKFTPISHATFVMHLKDIVVYVDPVGGAEAFEQQKPPNLILITDIHGDHLNVETLEAVSQHHTTIIAPQAVVDKLPVTLKKQAFVLGNGETKTYNHIKIEAIPMYNLRPEAVKFHTKGRGNGYVLTNHKERIYISGDTEDIPEMRNLKDIDIAFVCMNLPYTMPIDKAADAVLEFKPKEVIPYHYRGTEGLSDVNAFKDMVNTKNPEIKVTLLDWYSKN